MGAAVLLWLNVGRGDGWHIASAGIYGATLVAVYAASTLYHSSRRPRLKRALRVVDHCAIFLLIAGTYTPVTLVALRGAWGWTLFGLVWGLCLAGIVFKVLFIDRFAVLSTAAYVLIGWLGIIAVRPMLELLSGPAIGWLVAGGVAYTAGTFFYHSNRLPYAHAVWHLFVLAGSVFHYVAISLHVLSPGA